MRRRSLRAIAALVAFGATLALTVPAGAQTILNVERLQPGDVKDWHWGVEGALNLSSGNDDYVDLLSGVVLGHRWSNDWLRMFTGLNYHSETGKKLQNDKYLHLRLNHWLSGRWQTFHFFQYQSSRTKRLQRRVLLGSGVRRRVVGGVGSAAGKGTLDVGTGAMREMEDLDGAQVIGSHPVESRVWRMANLIVATRRLTESVRLLGVTYIQPDLSDFGDLRTLVDVSLQISLTENVDLTVRNEWRHDSRPPETVDHDDFVLQTGFTVSFR